MSGCFTSLDKKAERATYEAVSPRYACYIENDRGLIDLEKRVYLRTLYTWGLRLKVPEPELTYLIKLIKKYEVGGHNGSG